MSTAVSRWSLTSPKAKCAFDGVCSTGRPAECGLAKPGLFDSVNVKNHEKKTSSMCGVYLWKIRATTKAR
jgi:hypothetical protein